MLPLPVPSHPRRPLQVAACEYDALDITLLYVQITGIISQFQLRWHPNLSLINTALTIVNFDVDFISPDCWLSWSPLHSFYLQLSLPLIFLTYHTVTYGIQVCQ